MKECITDAFRRGVLRWILDADPRVALYTRQANFDRTMAAYTPENEVRGIGYQPGGARLEGGEIIETETGFVLVAHSPVWDNATITARGAVLYLAGDAGRTVRLMDFGRDIASTNDRFRVKLPGLAEGGVLSL